MPDHVIQVLIEAAKRELYRVPLERPTADLWTCRVGTVNAVCRGLITKQHIRLADDVCWLPKMDPRYRSRIVGDGRVEVWTITPLGWFAVARHIGGADEARQVLGPCPRDDIRAAG